LRSVTITPKNSLIDQSLLSTVRAWWSPETNGFGWCCAITVLVGAVSSAVPVMTIMVTTSYIGDKPDPKRYTFSLVIFWCAALMGATIMSGFNLLLGPRQTLQIGCTLWSAVFAASTFVRDAPTATFLPPILRNILVLLALGFMYGWVTLNTVSSTPSMRKKFLDRQDLETTWSDLAASFCWPLSFS
jgi:hypothetical protein